MRSYRSALSYVTGSHAFKVGFTLQEGPAITDVYTSHDTALIVRNGAPFQVTVRTTPYTARERLVADLGVFLQDTWTINRLTANLGLRFDYLNNKVEAQSASGGTWIGPRSFPALTDVPNYKDLAPRLGVAYDLFGNGKTAVKATLSRYIVPNTVAVARLLNPFNTSVNTTTRPWTDANNDGIPQVAELGALSNNAFGQVNVATQLRSRYDRRFREAPQQLGSLGRRHAGTVFEAVGGRDLLSASAGKLHDHRQPGRRSDRLRAVLRDGAARPAPAWRRRPADLRPLRHRADEVRRCHEQRGDRIPRSWASARKKCSTASMWPSMRVSAAGCS